MIRVTAVNTANTAFRSTQSQGSSKTTIPVSVRFGGSHDVPTNALLHNEPVVTQIKTWLKNVKDYHQSYATSYLYFHNPIRLWRIPLHYEVCLGDVIGFVPKDQLKENQARLMKAQAMTCQIYGKHPSGLVFACEPGTQEGWIIRDIRDENIDFTDKKLGLMGFDPSLKQYKPTRQHYKMLDQFIKGVRKRDPGIWEKLNLTPCYEVTRESAQKLLQSEVGWVSTNLSVTYSIQGKQEVHSIFDPIFEGWRGKKAK